MGEESLPLAKNFLIPQPRKIPQPSRLPPQQKSIPSTKQQFSSYDPIKTAFLAVVIALALFCFNFILFGHTDHVRFDFN